MNLYLLSPELALIHGALLVFGISLFEGRGRMAARVAALFALSAVVASAVSVMNGWQGDLFYGAYRVDLFSQLFKLVITLGAAAVILFGRELKDIHESVRPEYFLFLLLGTLGLVILVSSVELITLFVALELSSYALYLMVPLRRERPGLRVQMESAAKYVMFGVAATGILLFGMSYLFGLTGSTYFSEIAPALAARWSDPAAILGVAMVLAGLFFKLAAFPMHIWTPDVYQGASNETTAFIAGVPKAGAIAVIIRFLLCADPSDGTLAMTLTVVAVASMFFGNLAALVQKDIKRMLGYSSIAHAGYVLLGLVTLKAAGYAAAVFYIFGFVVMGLAAFLVICQVSRDGENVLIEDLSGLHTRAPLAAFVLGSSMFALAGIPPFVGFTGKFVLMTEALRSGYTLLVVLAAVNTAIGIYYYLSVVRVMYFAEAGDRPAVRMDAVASVVGVVLLLTVLAMGVLPSRLLEAALTAVRGVTL
ncbi:MAG: NADH-quinone oxidoreductase subunit N [Lentisphaerae bacterium RIFOXYB12_FULL_65_16]|nr:MAG: NADH-quinone oxidoreductase subunit N [Lentisphaerae bacterium RIFOXYA12_64_32]OGV93927.1 MAG: NADH-quinone oxidoreductase subunit N [Lentisphaerae bacterium RIFOXYB12_FULL_65_16]